MSSDSAEAKVAQPPSPEVIQELIDALKEASLDVSEAKRRVEAEYAGHVERLAVDTQQGVAAARASIEAYKSDLDRAVEAATRKLEALEVRSAMLAAKLSRDLTDSESGRTRLEAALETITSTIRQVRADRDTWEAQTRAAEARNEAALQDLRMSLADEKLRNAALEAANRRQAEVNAAMEERLTALEKKKVFGLF